MHTRRVLAPSHCLSRTGRRRRPGSGGGPEDDDIGDGGDGGGSGDGYGGGGDDSGEPWYGDEDPSRRGSSGLLWLWQAFCLCSFLQVCIAQAAVTQCVQPQATIHVCSSPKAC